MNGCDGIVERRDSAFYKSFAIRMPPDLISRDCRCCASTPSHSRQHFQY
jgi:hypothetical protein